MKARMTTRILSVVACLALLSVASSWAAEPPAYPDHRVLLVYRDDAGKEHPVRTAADWALRRGHIVAGLEQAMGKLPDRGRLPAPQMRVVEETPGQGFVRKRISLVSDDPQAAEGDRIPAYLYLPTGDGKPRAAVLALHPTGKPGKDLVAGNGPRANRQYALELAERGYVVLAPDYPSFGELTGYRFEDDRHASGTIKGVWNHLRCVDLLASLPEVDRTRIGVVGHSLGGHNALFAAAFDERLQVVVSSCGWCAFHEYRGMKGGKMADWTGPAYMPRIRDAFALDVEKQPFDFYEVVAAMAPRSFLSISPLKDDDFEVAGVKKVIPEAQRVYDLLGAGKGLAVRYPDCGHDFPTEERQAAYEYLDRGLKHEPTGK